MKLSLFSRINYLNGVINLNPYERNERDLRSYFNPSISSKYNRINLFMLIRIIISNLKLFFISLKKYIISRRIAKRNTFEATTIFLTYEEDKYENLNDKYFGDLLLNLNKYNNKASSKICVDVYGKHNSPYSILHLVTLIDLFKIILYSSIYIFYAIFRILIRFIFRQNHSSYHNDPYFIVLKSGYLFRLLFWDFAFRKFISRIKPGQAIVFLLEGASWEWLLLYHSRRSNSVFGYSHTFIRPDQFAVYRLINTFSRFRNFSILISDSWSLNLVRRWCDNFTHFKVESVRFLKKAPVPEKLKPSIDLLLIGGIDLDLTSQLLLDTFRSIEHNQNQKHTIIFKPHPQNFIEIPSHFNNTITIDSTHSLIQLIRSSRQIVVSASSAAFVDVLLQGKYPFIYLPLGFLDLCPIPIDNRCTIENHSNIKSLFLKDYHSLEQANQEIKLPFYFDSNNYNNWKTLLK